jgi:hypothetical protein
MIYTKVTKFIFENIVIPLCPLWLTLVVIEKKFCSFVNYCA